MQRPILFLLLLSLVSCRGCFSGRDDIDISRVSVDLRTYRLDSLLFHSHPDSLQAASDMAHKSLGGFYRIYVEDILQGAPVTDPSLPLMLRRFVMDEDWQAVQQAVDSVLGDLRNEEQLLGNAFRRLKVLFPDSLVPRLVTYNSGFNYGIFPTDSVLGLGLEWFIGQDHPVIGMLSPETFPLYVKERMRPEMLVPGAVKGWLFVHYMPDATGEDVLTNLVATGKAMYLLETILPEAAPHERFSFTEEQMKWVETNEYNIWKEIVAGDVLFSRKTADVNRLMNDAPFTHGFPRESPGHLGEWIGYRMVRSYMQANPNVTFAQLFQMNEPREILKHYKPR